MPALQQSAQLLAFPGAGGASPRMKLAQAFRQHRLPELLAEKLIHETLQWPGRSLPGALTSVLAARIRVAPLDLAATKAILLVGPAGGGKSAVAEKLEFAAKALGRGVERACGHEGQALLRERGFAPERLTIIEADGFNPANQKARSAFASLCNVEGVETIGVVSALCDAEDVEEVIASLRFRRVIVTGLDATRRLGATIAAITGEARLAHVTLGPCADDPLIGLTAPTLAKLLLDER